MQPALLLLADGVPPEALEKLAGSQQSRYNEAIDIATGPQPTTVFNL